MGRIASKLLENERVTVKLEAYKKIFDEKVKKLTMKIDNIEDVIQDMSNELWQLRTTVFKYARGEKFVALTVVMS